MKKIYIFLCAILCTLSTFGQWIQLNSGTSNNLNCVYFTSNNVGYAAGEGATSATILKTINGGTTWSPQTINTLNPISSLSFGSSDVGYALTNKSELFKTTNAGSTWLNIRNFGGSPGHIFFQNKDTGFVAYIQGVIYRTKNGGSTWDSVSTANLFAATSIHFPSTQIGYIVTQTGMVAKTTDMGTSWSMLPQPTSNFLFDVFFTSIDTGYAVGGTNNSSLILKTINGGNSWTAQTVTPSTQSYNLAVFFTNSNTGYISNGGSKLYKTTDGGSNWNAMSAPFLITMDIYFPSDSIGYAVGINGAILKLNSCQGVISVTSQPNSQTVSSGKSVQFAVTTNVPSATYKWQTDFGLGFQDLINTNKYSGTNTSSLNISNVTLSNHLQPFRAIAYYSGCSVVSNVGVLTISNTCIHTDTVRIAVTDTLIINTILTGLNPPNTNVIKVFPNPAKTHVFINTGNYSLMNNYSIRIVNNLGQQVFNKLINQQQFDIDLSALSAGLYLLQIINAQNTIIDTRKIIIE